jgi:hypothetical protein
VNVFPDHYLKGGFIINEKNGEHGGYSLYDKTYVPEDIH